MYYNFQRRKQTLKIFPKLMHLFVYLFVSMFPFPHEDSTKKKRKKKTGTK